MSRSKKNRQLKRWKRSVDLHGLRVDEAIARLDRILNDCLVDGEIEKIEVIHGIGTGKIKQAVMDYLQGINVISGFHEDVANPGTLWVDL